MANIFLKEKMYQPGPWKSKKYFKKNVCWGGLAHVNCCVSL